MNIKRHPALLLLTVALPLLCACQPSPSVATSTPTNGPVTGDAPQTVIGRSVEKAMVEARAKLRSENISISDGTHININGHEFKHDDKLPSAQITPQGDLLVDGKHVAVDPAQRKLLLEYRNHIIVVADTGMAIGVKGADLAGKAISETIGGLIRGDTDGIERKIEADARNIEADAMKLCAQLPPMLATQEQLATSLPAFKPYATMTQDDIDDCGKDKHHDAKRAQVRERVRAEIRETVRNTVRGTTKVTVRTDSAEAKTDAPSTSH